MLVNEGQPSEDNIFHVCGCAEACLQKNPNEMTIGVVFDGCYCGLDNGWFQPDGTPVHDMTLTNWRSCNQYQCYASGCHLYSNDNCGPHGPKNNHKCSYGGFSKLTLYHIEGMISQAASCTNDLAGMSALYGRRLAEESSDAPLDASPDAVGTSAPRARPNSLGR